jgi:perosamine synthetase
MIPLYKPHMPPLPELDDILHSGQLAYGKYARSFEENLQNFLGKDAHVWVTNSFHMAISVAISLLEIHPFDEVIASPMACLASTQPFAAQAIKVRWADVDPHTGTLDPGSVKEKINRKTRAIMHNHFCGYPGYIDEINEIGKECGIPVIDDGIECFGSEYKGKRIGNCGTDITIFSFNAVRLPNTVDGGAIVINAPELYRKAELIRDCGINRGKFRDELGEINTECDITLTGYSATMSDVNAYIGLQIWMVF